MNEDAFSARRKVIDKLIVLDSIQTGRKNIPHNHILPPVHVPLVEQIQNHKVLEPEVPNLDLEEGIRRVRNMTDLRKAEER